MWHSSALTGVSVWYFSPNICSVKAHVCLRFGVTNSCQQPPSLYRENLSRIWCVFTLWHGVNPKVFYSCIRCVFHSLLQRFVGECRQHVFDNKLLSSTILTLLRTYHHPIHEMVDPCNSTSTLAQLLTSHPLHRWYPTSMYTLHRIFQFIFFGILPFFS